MRVIFPYNPSNKHQADGPFEDEHRLLVSWGMECSLFDFDALPFAEFHPKPAIKHNERILYRGWMMNPEGYEQLTQLVGQKGGQMITSAAQYRQSHHLPGWYDRCQSYTAETVFIEHEKDVSQTVKQLGWERMFVKDYVKSNYDERGSVACNAQEVEDILALIKLYRGELEGGIAVRRFEAYLPDTEQRCFVLNGQVYASGAEVPDLVRTIAGIHHAPFYSVDVIKNTSGNWRLVELGDGQVSDKKNWPVEAFCEIFKTWQ